MDMGISSQGQHSIGHAVLPKEDFYFIEITSPGRLDLLTFTTCNRELIQEKTRGQILNSKKASVQYQPVGPETQGGCLSYLGGFESKKGRHVWGLIDYQDDETKLPAKITCDGFEYVSQGVTICQSRAGLIQEIKFKTPTNVNEPEGCEIEEKTPLWFRFKIKKGYCIYLFHNGQDRHRLTTYGYEQILIRG